jgi:hypothetical protein
MQNEITEALCDLHQKLLTKLTDKQHVYVFNGGEIRKMADLVLDAAIECGRIAALAAARPTPSVDTEARTPLPPAVTESELVEALRPHVEKIANCIRINDEMGCVVIGQTDAARALKEIFDRFANIGKD